MKQNEYINPVETGSLKISDDVLASITAIASKEIEGVAELVPAANIKSMFKTKNVKTPVLIDLNDGVAIIDVYLKIKYGAKVNTVATEVQKKVKDAVQNMTGIAVSKVNVHIAGISIEDKKNK